MNCEEINGGQRVSLGPYLYLVDPLGSATYRKRSPEAALPQRSLKLERTVNIRFIKTNSLYLSSLIYIYTSTFPAFFSPREIAEDKAIGPPLMIATFRCSATDIASPSLPRGLARVRQSFSLQSGLLGLGSKKHQSLIPRQGASQGLIQPI
jgi:hypothetical protein